MSIWSINRETRLRVSWAPLFCLCLMTGFVVAQNAPLARDTKDRHPASGTSIVRFAEIDDGVYKGSRPRSDGDYRFLQSKNVKTIIELKFFPLLYRFEAEKAEQYGMKVLPVTINASPVAPSEAHVRRILCLLADKRLRPIYFHCSIGRDRTSLIATLYELYFRGLVPSDARKEMRHLGYKDDWTLRGLRSYLEKHVDSPFAAEAECGGSGTHAKVRK